ncbi:MAG TPA: YceI family protein [Ktedonobacterales bacterium]
MAWEIDTAHSSIEFTAKHMMVTNVRGRFNTFSGDAYIDEANPERSRVDVTIDLASLATGNEGRDQHLRSADFFDVEQYPTATFHSTSVEPRGEDRLHMIGDLTIRGVTKPVTLDVTIEGKFKDMQGKERYGITATTSFSRKEFGLEWNVALESGGWLVSDKITIAIDAQVVAPAEVSAAD